MGVVFELYEAEDLSANERNGLVILKTWAAPPAVLQIRITPPTALRLARELSTAAGVARMHEDRLQPGSPNGQK